MSSGTTALPPIVVYTPTRCSEQRQNVALDSIEATECDIVTTGLKETLRHILAFARRADSVARAAQ